MTARNNDPGGHWRCRTIGFRLSPEEEEQFRRDLEDAGTSRQDFILKMLLNEKLSVLPNARIQEKIIPHLKEMQEQLERLEKASLEEADSKKIHSILDEIRRVSGQ